MAALVPVLQCLALLWGVGDLSYLLHESQEALLQEFRESTARRFVVCSSRRWGKTWWACTLAVETALNKDDARICYAFPTQKQAKRIVVPVMKKILADCPPDKMPRFRVADLTWTFPNGAQIILAGCDKGNAENLRGDACDLGILDEAGFIDDLKYVVQSILLPQCLTVEGRLVLVSTPSRSPAHPFVSVYMFEAEERGELVKRTIYDAPHVTDEMRVEFMRESGGEDSSDWQREYLVQETVDEARAIVVEFSREEAHLIVELPDEPHVDRYVIADFGFNDLTVIGFWEWRFSAGKAYLVDELVYQNTGSAAMVPDIKAKELALWGEVPPRDRFGDADRLVLADLCTEHDLPMALPRKDNKDAQINALRLACSEHRVAVHPRCTTTIAHLKHGIWNKSRTSFDRSGDEFGHFDGVDMMVYGYRHIDRTRNPYPAFGGANQNTHHVPPADNLDGNSRTILDAIRG